ncbi:nuclear transport factor 2 family protein [Kribbella sp. NPDC051586]|uniref:nuclear transport factor 2 family protein n=1 Tax=Kribbella sp. NPDC051586 TaxID=3364118 RepID=UPI0037A43E93
MTTDKSVSREAMDRLLDAHFRAEQAGDAQATVQTLTDDVIHDVVGDPLGELHGPSAAGKRYDHLFGNVRGQDSQVLHRLYGDNFLVDDKIWTARVDGEFMGLPGNGRTISVRVLHVFEFRGDRIARENVWIDGASAIAQLTAP